MSNVRDKVWHAVVPVLAGLLLGGCAVSPGVAGTPGDPGGASASVSTPAYPFTPAATPTIMPSGAFDKVSTGGPTLAPTAGGPLNDKVIVLDPGHNGAFNPALNNRHVDTPFGKIQCAATGTETADRTVSEHQLNWQVSARLVDLLRERGATVILTRPDDEGVGPCNIDRARIANRVNADFLISVHADGQNMGRAGIADPQGFHVQLDTKMVGGPELLNRSMAGAENVIRNMLAMTEEPLTNYVPRKPAGIWQRSAELMVLAGLEKTPGVLIEMGNLKNPANLARLVDPAHQQKIAAALEAAIEDTLLKPEYMTPSPTPTPSTASPSGSASASASASPRATGSASAQGSASPSGRG